MNERIAKLYEQAIIIEDGGDYVCGELDPVKFAELIVRECMNVLAESREVRQTAYYYRNRIAKHFGVEE
jgi:hypothetical protein